MIRVFDIILSALALLILAPILVPVMIILRFSGEGEVFYVQQRVGRNKESFGLIKFATMLKNSPDLAGGYLTKRDDPRVLPFGKFLRKAKINELPQLINIFKGDMSVVGPRPQAKPHFELYLPEIQDEIAAIPPGLTGVGSIIFRDEESIMHNSDLDPDYVHDQVIAPYKGRLEAWFASHRSLRLYFSVIFVTAWVVVFPNSQMPGRVFRGLPNPPPELGLKFVT